VIKSRGQAEQNMRDIKMHTKVWAKTLKKVTTGQSKYRIILKLSFKWVRWRALVYYVRKRSGLCKKITSWPSALPTSQFDPGQWSHAVGQESVGMPFVRLVFAQRCGWVCLCVLWRNRLLSARWDWKFLTTRNTFRSNRVFLPLEFGTKMVR
jgi:hypothetical protein